MAARCCLIVGARYMLCISSRWVATAIGESCVSASPRASHQVKNRVTAAAYAARVCGLRIWAVKNSTVRSAASRACLGAPTFRPRRSREVDPCGAFGLEPGLATGLAVATPPAQ